jgi:hypothetical protein
MEDRHRGIHILPVNVLLVGVWVWHWHGLAFVSLVK